MPFRGYIYVLEDPRQPGVIRYVGKTCQTLKARQKRHLGDVGKEYNKRTNWLAGLLAAGFQPIIRAIFQWDDPTLLWPWMETNFELMLRQLGHPLTNSAPTGFGGPSPETARRIGIANTGKTASAETRAKMSAAQKGRKRSFEAIAKTAAANRGQKRTPEQCELFRAVQLGRPPMSAETIAKIVAKNTGKKRTPEQVEKTASKLRGRTLSSEQVEKTASKLRGRPSPRRGSKLSVERIEKTASKLRGKKHTAEHNQRISIGNARRWDRVREAKQAMLNTDALI